MRSTRWAIGAVVVCLLSGPALAGTDPAGSARELFREMARASGVGNPDRVARYEEAFDRVLERAVPRAELDPPT